MRSFLEKILMLSLLFFVNAAAWAVSFDANLDFTVKGKKYTSKLYYADDRSRQNVRNDMGEEEILIVRKDLKKMWYLDPNLKTYYERPFDLNVPASIGIFDAIKNRAKETLIGTEKINGHEVEKYLIEIDSKDKKIQFYAWRKPGEQVPLKVMDVKNIVTFEYSDVNYREQDKSLFELPAGIKKAER